VKKVCFKKLNPCEGRKLNIQQYVKFFIENDFEITEDIEKADYVMIWTCGFRNDYLENSQRVIEDLKQNYRGEVIVAGCMPDIIGLDRNHRDYTVIPWRHEEKINHIFSGAKRLNQITKSYCVEKKIDNLEKFRRENPSIDVSFADQFIQLYINEGCALQCTYCSERLMFPVQTSFPMTELVMTCKEVVERTGEYEVILQGDNPGSYGEEIDSSLPQLIEKLLEIHADVKVGIANLNPIYVLKYFDFFEYFIKSGRMLHIRVPIQSASDTVLQKMARGYRKKDITKIFDLFHETGFKEFSTDMIIGFPYEKENDFDETLEFIAYYEPTYVNLSRYMSLEAISSYGFDNQVSEYVKNIRLKKADALFKSIGIFCNTDSGEHVKERQKRMYQYHGLKGLQDE